jgi:VWFA-related protein
MRLMTSIVLTLLFILVGFAQVSQVRKPAGRIEIDVAAVDKSGTFNTTLKESDFSVFFDNVKQDIVEFIEPGNGAHVQLLFDHNHTWLVGDTPTQSKQLWNQLQNGISIFMNSLGPKDWLEVAAFESRTSTILPWHAMQSGRPVTARLSEITAPSTAGKDMYGALTWATGQFSGAKGRKAVIVFTDGRDARLTPRWFQADDRREVLDPLAGLEDEGETSEFRETLNIVRNSGVQIYFVAPYPDHNARFPGPTGRDYSLNGVSGNSTLAEAYLRQVRSRMEQLAEATGGSVLYSDQPADTPALYASLPARLSLSHTYHLVIATERNDRIQRIQVEIRNGEFRVLQSRFTY